MSSLIITLSAICLIICFICLMALKMSSNIPRSVQAIVYLLGVALSIVVILSTKKEE